MKTIQEQLCDRVYELLPEKKELEFGCDLFDKVTKKEARIIGNSLYFGEDGDYEFNIIIFEHKAKDVFMWQDNSDSLLTKEYKDPIPVDFEIIGQPLGIAELLLAIGKQDLHYVKMWVSDNIDTHNLILEIDNDIKSRVKYDLSQDNLLNQSNELCELCLGLLNK